MVGRCKAEKLQLLDGGSESVEDGQNRSEIRRMLHGSKFPSRSFFP